MKSLVLLSFSLTFLTQVLADDYFAEEPSEQAMPMESEEEERELCISPYHNMNVGFRHNEARGIGYRDGYTTVEVFGIYDGIGTGFMPFFDLRGHLFNDRKWAGNVGIGERTLMSNYTFGSYVYYDVRQAGHGLTINQLSPGLELVGKRMEYRINGYFPVGKNKGRKFGYDFNQFTGNHILLKFKQDQAMMGGDAEVGIHIPQNTTYDIYTSVGSYYFHSSNASGWGGRARLLGRFKEYVTLEVDYSYDRLFRSIVQGSVAFTVPFGGKLKRCTRCCDNNLLLSRASFAPSRFEIPVVKKVRRKEKAINPVTGNPWVVWFVDNTSHSAGTFESPFSTLLAAQNASSPNDMIYVFPGDGTTNGMNAGITLQDGQNFFGSGIKQQFATKQGTITIPAMSSNNPLLTTGSGHVVTLGNGNVVSGFNISSAVTNASGIGSIAIVQGATIRNNTITMTGNTGVTAGIFVTGFGPINISNNQVTGPMINALIFGIAVNAEGGVASGMINNNLVSGFNFGIVCGTPVTNLGAYDMTIQGNTVQGYVSQGIVGSMLGTSTINIIGNTVMTNNNFNSGIAITDGPNTASGRFTIANNQVIVGGSATFGGIGYFSAVPASWNLSGLVADNLVQGANSSFVGFNFNSSNSDMLCLTFDNNTYVNSAGGTGLFLSTTGTGVINIDSLQGNIVAPISSTGNVFFVAPGTCGN